MKFAAQMDDIASINIKKDSTFAVLFAAQERGHEIFYYLPNQLNYDFTEQKLTAIVRKIRLTREEKFYEILDESEQDLRDFDVILVRQDPPFNMDYITSTYLLEKIRDHVIILNNPTEIRNAPEKLFIADFPDLTPPTIVTSNVEKVADFRAKIGDIILKPLYACGGQGIVLLKKDDMNLSSIFTMMMQIYQAPIVAQKFLPEVKDGDKRILLINGVAHGGITRMAKSGEVRSNLDAGGEAVKLDLSAREQEICRIIGPELKRRGLFFVGIDVIGGYLTEINVTSPTGIVQTNKLNNVKIDELIVKEIEKMARGL